MNPKNPPKHKTPNYRLVRHVLYALPFGKQMVRCDWEPVPLRATRKDLGLWPPAN